MFDKLHEECGVFGIYGHPEAANMAYLGLYALQHRGQESAGIAVVRRRANQGAAGRWATSPRSSRSRRWRRLPGHIAIGHTRYSTAGESTVANAQPLLIDCVHGQVGICHNGNIVNAREIRDELVRAGVDLPDQQRHRGGAAPVRPLAGTRPWTTRIVESVARLTGAFSLRLHHQGPPGRRPRSARLPSAGPRATRRRLGGVLGDLRDGPRRRDLRARRGARGGADHRA